MIDHVLIVITTNEFIFSHTNNKELDKSKLGKENIFINWKLNENLYGELSNYDKSFSNR